MTTPGHTCHTPTCTAKVPVVLQLEDVCLSHYLERAFHRLAEATRHFQNDRDMDYEAMRWLLAQVDCTVDLLAEEDTIGDADQRSKLLELLLGVANFNEYVRHHFAMTQPRD
jgi:hypothetical protein